MMDERLERGGNANDGLTRISVRGSRDHFIVRTGHSAPVRVSRRGAQLVCECGQPNCVHIASLKMCGFVETARDCDLPRAA